MAKPHDVIENPVTGERIVFRRTAAESAGEAVSFDYFLRSGGSVPLAHVHPRQQEELSIVSGRARVRVGRHIWRVTAGETVVVPQGAVHRLWNDGEDELHAIVDFRPALRTEEGFEQLFGLARDGKLNKRGLPHPLQIAVMAGEYRDELLFPIVPRFVQSALFAVLGPIGKRRGYRAFDPSYGSRIDGPVGAE